MILALCVDEGGGLAFNRRRQSQDRLVREDLLREAGGRPLWMSSYSHRQFAPGAENLRTAEDFLDQAGPGELCFVEDRDPLPWAGRVEAVIVYCWNRRYPADVRCTLDWSGWTLERREEFSGFSHEKITKEVYRR